MQISGDMPGRAHPILIAAERQVTTAGYRVRNQRASVFLEAGCLAHFKRLEWKKEKT